MARDIETYTLRTELINDLIEVYSEVAPNCLSAPIAYKMTVEHPAKRFYVTPKQVYQRINLYIKGRTEEIDSLRPVRRQMYKDLISTILHLQKFSSYRNCSLRKLCKIAVMQPAPRFYISPKFFNSMLSLYARGLMDEHGRDIRYVEKMEKQRLSSLS